MTTMAFNPFVGMIFLIASVLGAFMGVIVARIIAEFVLIVFRINEHLGAIRNQGNGRGWLIRTVGPVFAKSAKEESALIREAEMHDVAVMHDIILAFEPHLAGVARAGFAVSRRHNRHSRWSRRG